MVEAAYTPPLAPPAPAALDALRLDAEQRQMQVVFTIVLAPLAVFAMSDLLLNRDNLDRFLLLAAVRLGLLGVLIAGLARLRRIRDRTSYTRTVAWSILACVPLVLVVHLLRPPHLLTPFAIEALLVGILYIVLPNNHHWQRLTAGLLTAGSLGLLVFWHTDVSAVEYISVLTTLFVANAVGITVAHFRAERERREEATFEQLRLLHGILPICAHCHRIRDAAGGWEPLHQLVTRTASAEFSHGICPACLEQHYGETLHTPASRTSSP